LYMTSTLIQVAVHLGSIITLSHYYGDHHFSSEIVMVDLPFIILTFLFLILKYVAGRYHEISISPDAAVVICCTAFEILPAILAPEKHELMKHLLTIVSVTRVFTIGWLLTRTTHFFTVEMLLRKALPTLMLILLNILMCIIFANIIGQAVWGGIVWVEGETGMSEFGKSGIETAYSFNNTFNAMLLLFVSTFKGYTYADTMHKASDSIVPYLFFSTFWIFVGLVNLLLFKSIIFHSYWGESKRLQLTNKWLASKCTSYFSREFPADAHESRGKKPEVHNFIWHILHILLVPCFGWSVNPSEVAKSLGIPMSLHFIVEPEYEVEVDEIMRRHNAGKSPADLEMIERQA